MKQVLVVNNYSMRKSLEWSRRGEFPRQHTWGTDMLQEKANLRFYVHTLPPILHRLHLARIWYYIQNIIILFKAIGCDAIYVAASPLIDLIGFLKYLHLYRKRIVVVVHHPGNFSLKKQCYDKLIFICKAAYEKALIDYPQYKELFIYQQWGPDLGFYKGLRAQNNDISFVGNGITDRDNFTLVAAAVATGLETAILCNQQSIPDNYNEDTLNISLIYNEGTMMNGKILPYSEMIKLVSKYSICVIPTKEGRTTLCGLTSFCDAIALGMPVILADTTHIDVDFDKYPFGFYYKAEDKDDLINKMKWFSQNGNQLSKMSKISRQYAEEYNYSKFAETICREVLK